MNKAFNKDTITLKYSQTEEVTDPKNIQHKIFKQVLTDFGTKGIEISSIADVPAGTGLGSSSTFTVALLRLLYTWNGQHASAYKIAKEACEVEIEKLGNPIGKQDQFAASFGGLRYYEFEPDGFVKVEPVIMKSDAREKLERNLLMFYTGDVRSANNILAKENHNLANDQEKINTTLKLCEMTRFLREKLENGDVDALGPVLKESWEMKKSLAQGISNPLIDEAYEQALKAGATGGKLLGAGGGGFLLFYCENETSKERVRNALSLTEMPFEFDRAGCSIIFME